MDNVRERKEKPRYTFIMVPDAKSQETRTVSVSRIGLIAAILAILLFIASCEFALFVYTPLGSHLPLAGTEVVRQYGRQIVDIENQLRGLLREISILRGYNLRLRKALGEGLHDSLAQQISSADSALAMRAPATMDALGVVDEPADTSRGGGVPAIPAGASAAIYAAQFSGGMVRELPLTMPAEGVMSRSFEPEKFHYGLDVAGRPGSPVLAAADGTVIFGGWTYDDGFTLMIAHEDGFVTVYKHNEAIVRNSGESVRRGELIALLGNTGKTSSGPHLHFEVWVDGIAQDPTNYLLTTQ